MPEQPMYREIADKLRLEIESGQLSPGSQLPTEFELRELHDASRNTIRDAIKWLITRGLVETRPGQGTFVVDKIDPFVTTLTTPDPRGRYGGGDVAAYLSEVKARRRKPSSSEPRVEVQRPRAEVAAALQLEDGAQVVGRHLKRSIDGRSWSLLTSFYPMSLVQEGAVRLIQADDIEEGAIGYLEKNFGIRQVGYRDKILVRPPDVNETGFFKLPSDGRISVVEILRTGYDSAGKPFVATVTVYPADRNQFVVDVGDVPPEITDTTESTGSGTTNTPAGGPAAGD